MKGRKSSCGGRWDEGSQYGLGSAEGNDVDKSITTESSRASDMFDCVL